MRITKLACCFGILFAASTCVAQMYTVTDLGTLGGSISVAYGINDSGQVVGWSYTGAYDPDYLWMFHAFRTAPNSPINPATDDLGTLGYYSSATAINASGQVVGWSYTSANIPGSCCTQHAFRTAPNMKINPATDDLGTLGGLNSTAYGINDAGQVVGESENGNTCPSPRGPYSARHAFRTTPNSPIAPAKDDLGTLGGCWSTALGINGSGQVVGTSQGESGFESGLHAFRVAANSSINPATDDLGTLGGVETTAYAINDFGQVVGTEYVNDVDDGGYHAFRTAPNRHIDSATDDLGEIDQAIWPAQPSPATAINNYGQVVGGSPAFVYDNGAMHTLNALIPADSGWDLTIAYGINDAGQIVGMGKPPGMGTGYGIGRGYLLTPIYRAFVQPPINADGSSVFNAKRRAIPLKFTLTQNGAPTCALPPAAVAVSRTAGGAWKSQSEMSFRIEGCQYGYILRPSALGIGTYRVDISINGIMVGHAVFGLKYFR